jgi:hypothetical protein
MAELKQQVSEQKSRELGFRRNIKDENKKKGIRPNEYKGNAHG